MCKESVALVITFMEIMFQKTLEFRSIEHTSRSDQHLRVMAVTSGGGGIGGRAPQ